MPNGFRRERACVLVVAILILAACGDGDEDRNSTVVTTVTTITSNPPSPTTTKVEVAYPAGGPKGPVIPRDTPAYQWLAEGRCNELLRAIDHPTKGWLDEVDGESTERRLYVLYKAAAEACLQRWERAAVLFEELVGSGEDFSIDDDDDDACPAQEGLGCRKCHRLVYEWVADLLRRRQADPQFSPNYVKSKAPNPCPTTTTSSTSSSTSSSTTTSSTSSSTSSSTTTSSSSTTVP